MDLFSKPQAPDTDPWWPTSVMGRKSGGRILGTDNSVWLFAKVPLSPVTDARSPAEALAAGEPLRLALEEIASTTHVRVNRRSVSKANYRDVHMLLVNVPDDFKPPPGSPIAGAFPDAEVLRRVLLLGVRLKSRYGDGGLRSAVDSVVETWTVGGTPIEDFDRDFENMSAIMARSGLQTMTDTDFALANGYWNKGKSPDTPMLVHDDHLHIFSSTSSMHAAARLKARDGDDECASWQIPNHHTLTFGTVRSFDFGYPDATSSAAQWASALINAGAVCVSVRGRLEPATVTRSELRKGKKKYLDDINERLQQNKMARAEQEEMLAELDELERYYATGGPATLMDASTLVVISGQVGMHGYDMSEFATNSRLELSTMTSRQNQAMAETWLASPMRANPYLHDLPTITVGAAGLSGLSSVGDRDGATLGFTENDRQHAMISPTAAADEDSLPIMICVGQSGSGKTATLLYLADQFSRMRTPSGDRTSVIIIDPKALALDTLIPTPDGFKPMSDMEVGDSVFGRDGDPCRVIATSDVFLEPDLYDVEFDDGQVIAADAGHQWVVLDNRGRTMAVADAECDGASDSEAIRMVMARFGDGDHLSAKEILNEILAAGCTRWRDVQALRPSLAAASVCGKEFLGYSALVALKALADRCESDYASNEMLTLTTSQMIEKGIALKNGQTRWAVPVAEPFSAPDAELPIDPWLLGAWLGDGCKSSSGIACGQQDADFMFRMIGERWMNVSVQQPSPSATSTAITISLVRDMTLCPFGHSERTVRKTQRRTPPTESYCTPCHLEESRIRTGLPETRQRTNPSFIEMLRVAGVFNRKHIPDNYKLASVAQRMALLQGLMDTDGTVKRRGDSRISLSDPTLAADVVELLRGLGFKIKVWRMPASVTVRDSDGTSRRERKKDTYCITWRTSRPIFTMPRKLAALPDSESFRSRFHLIVDIRPTTSRPAKCLVVDSLDHTYLAGQFIPTHNSGSDHSAVVLAAGGTVASLDNLLTADGIFDPIRFSANRGSGVELAASMLMAINPWGSDASDYEMPITRAIAYGVDRGADCIGVALQMALKDGIAENQMVAKVLDLAVSSPMFRACIGSSNGGQSLRAAEGITYINVGTAHLDIPAPGTPSHEVNLNQRIALALVRMMVFGSAAALTGRSGVLMLDEAWVMLSAGRSEMERLGRLARSQQVLPMLFTQRVTDALDAGLTGYISRGIILPIQDENEAAAACQLFKLESTPERMERITARATMGMAGAEAGTAPNWNSMRALRDPKTNRVLRGAVGIYIDLAGRAVPVEIQLPEEFLRLASTNPEDIRRRQAALAAGAR